MEQKSKRILQIRDYFCNGNNQLFADKVGFTMQYVSNLAHAKKNISANFLEVSRAWLYFGEGNMLKSDNSTQHGTFGENTGIIVQHGGGGDTYNNQINSELMQIVKSQQQTIQELTEQNKILTLIIANKVK